MTLFADVALAPRDPILGLAELYQMDENPAKVNLGIGIYTGEDGKIPVLQCVATAQKKLLESMGPKGYLPIDGMAAYDKGVKELVFGKDSEPVKSGRVATVQTLGGTGGLKVGADFLYQMYAGAQVLISDPTWDNHRSVFERAGFKVAAYPYYDAENRAVDFDGMLNALKLAEEGTIVVLHACCHNPTGCDLSPEQWERVIMVLKNNGLIPFLDMAYQGFGDGFVEDGIAINKLLNAGMRFLMSTSFSKTFSMYGERVGALSVVCATQDEALRVVSQLKMAIRSNYSNPPTFGAQVVAAVLNDADLSKQWHEELAAMRTRIKSLRANLVAKLIDAGVKQDVSFIVNQKGMFSYSGLSKDQMLRLRAEFGVYGLDSGRICVACLNAKNIDYVAKSMAAVMKD